MQLTNSPVSTDSTFFAQLVPGSAGPTAAGTPDAGEGPAFDAIFNECASPAPLSKEATEAGAQLAACFLLPTVATPTPALGLPEPNAAAGEETPGELTGEETADSDVPNGWSHALTSGHGLKLGLRARQPESAGQTSPTEIAADETTEGAFDPVAAKHFDGELPVPAENSGKPETSRGSGGHPMFAEARTADAALSTGEPAAPLRPVTHRAQRDLTSPVATEATEGVPPIVADPVARSAVAARREAGLTARDLGSLQGMKDAVTAAAESGVPLTEDAQRFVRAEVASSTAEQPVPSVPAPGQKTVPTANDETLQFRPDLPENSQANFAPRFRRTDLAVKAPGKAALKSFVTTEGEGVETDSKAFGIDVAKEALTMASRFPTSSAPSSAHLAGGWAAPSAATSEASAPAAADRPAVMLSSAHEAVEVVLEAVSHVAAREQKSVQLQFRVGDADLKVRVELHADQVKTTFRTDSHDLRTALAQEWQSVASTVPSGDRQVRLVPAVFTGNDSSAFNASAGDSSSRQREQQAQREMNETGFAAVRQIHTASQATPTLPTVAAAPAASRHSLHLQTVA